jgi:hypothetical protein
MFHAYCIAAGFQDFSFEYSDTTFLRRKVFVEILQWFIIQKDDEDFFV